MQLLLKAFSVDLWASAKDLDSYIQSFELFLTEQFLLLLHENESLELVDMSERRSSST